MTGLGSRLYTLIALLPLLAYGTPSDGTKEVDVRLRLQAARIAPDGYERVAVTVEGKMPGPLIKAQKGDVLNINVINELNDAELYHSSSIHWHGLHMYNKNYDDGASTVTQCPITPNSAYQYTVPTRNQAGTFWYHSHFSSQYCDGLRGPLIVYDPQDPHKALYDIDDESTIISLTDWYEKPGKNFHPDPVKPGPRVNSTLINGLGIKYNTDGQSGQLSVISVRPNKRYRMRLINMACDFTYMFSIDGHTLKVIEADSIPIKPVDVDGMEIHAGQRYSFVLATKFGAAGNFWIRARPTRGVQETRNFAKNINVAILRYARSPNDLPSPDANVDVPPLNNLLRESTLETLEDLPVPGVPEVGKADVSLTLPTIPYFDTGMLGFGGPAFKPPAVPILLQIMSGARKQEDILPQGSVHVLPPNKTIEIIMPGDGVAGPHPFHLHGHDFWVVKSDDAPTIRWTKTIMRDTVNTGKDPNVTTVIRFRTDNPGPWFLHCHVDWHLDAGLGVVFVEDPKTTANDPDKKPTRQWDDLCKVYNKYKDDGYAD